jgi:hypothetical protein
MRALASNVLSLCKTPFGIPVVPEVKVTGLARTAGLLEMRWPRD